MPINNTKKIAFIHIPRTGGTYIEHLLGIHNNRKNSGLGSNYNRIGDLEHLFGRNLQHLTFFEMITILGDLRFEYKWISIVRNPTDRFVSFLNHTMQCPQSTSNILSLLDTLFKILLSYIKMLLKETLLYKLITNRLHCIPVYSPRIQHLRSQHAYLYLNKHLFSDKHRNVQIDLYPFRALKVIDKYVEEFNNNYIINKKPNRSIKGKQKKFNMFIIKLVARVIWYNDYKLYKNVDKEWSAYNRPLELNL